MPLSRFCFPALTAVACLAASASAQDRPWQSMSDPAVADLAPNFAAPPAAYSSQIAWGWTGPINREVIARDLDHIHALNLSAAWIEPGRNPDAPYLSPAYFENVRIAVEEARKRGMHLWFDDDGGYPSGFAGGLFTVKRPDLDMKALAPTEAIPVAPGATLTRTLDDKAICAVAVDLASGKTEVIETPGGQLSWTAPADGRWEVDIARWYFHSGITRSANNKSGRKDGEHSLMDYLDPAADQLFVHWTFDAYKQAVGDEFGKTVFGFRGDEAAFGFNPWTPNFLDEFQRRKGYDLRPYLPAISRILIGRGGRRAAAAPVVLDADHRAFADYCDVWSDLFGENFFGAEGRWCAQNGVEMQTHIEHEEMLPMMAIADGDFFKCMRGLAIPGIDVIWHQMWHDVVADFPKLASSATHLNGHPQAMSESFAAMNGLFATPDLSEVGWILNHQITLGINHFEYMSMRASTGIKGVPYTLPPGSPQPPPIQPGRGVAPAGYRYLDDPSFPALALYVNRVTYVLSQGKPGAEIGVYIPSSSFWFGDVAANRSFLAVTHALLEHQRDLDFVDEDALAASLELRGGEFVNRSGQAYRAIVVPRVTVISRAALDRLQAFARAGGVVVFVGPPPPLATGRNFLGAGSPGDLSWAVNEPSGEVTPAVLAALPRPEVALSAEAPGLKYVHRRLKDGDAYFFFNEGDGPIDLKADVETLAGADQAQDWDARTGRIEPLDQTVFADGRASIPLRLQSWETKLVVLSR